MITAPFGRAVMRNGYSAYAICQGWGNDPAAFTHAGAEQKPKNEALLDTLVADRDRGFGLRREPGQARRTARHDAAGDATRR